MTRTLAALLVLAMTACGTGDDGPRRSRTRDEHASREARHHRERDDERRDHSTSPIDPARMAEEAQQDLDRTRSKHADLETQVSELGTKLDEAVAKVEKLKTESDKREAIEKLERLQREHDAAKRSMRGTR